MDAAPVMYPLPDAQLPQVDVSPDTLVQWKNEAEHFVRDAVHNRQSWYFRFQDYQHLYKPIYAKHNTHGCARVIKSTKVVEFLGRGELDMTLDELANALYCRTSVEQRAVYAQLYQTACMDGALLKFFEGQKPSDPFHCVAAKWVALRPPMSRIFKGSDFIYFEYCFTTIDINGRKVLIEFKKSQSLRPDQLKDHDLDLTRGSMCVLNTYYMENKRVVMHTMGEHDIAGKFPVWFALSVMPTFFERVQNHHGLLYARSLTDAGITVNSLADRHTEASTGCRVCNKKFKLTRGMKWCRGCGHAVCRDCAAEIIMLEGGVISASRLPSVRERFCSLCLFQVRERRMLSVDRESEKERPSVQFSIGSDEVNKFELSRITAAVNSIDGLFDRRARHSLDESLLSMSMLKADDKNEEDELSRRTTRSSSLYYIERESSLSTEPRSSVYTKSIDLVDMARVAADQATMLRSIYQQECLLWQRQTQVRRRCSIDEIVPTTGVAASWGIE